MNFRRVRSLVYLGALVLPGMILTVTSIQKNQVPRPLVSCPSGLGQLTADGGAPPPTLPPKKPGSTAA